MSCDLAVSLLHGYFDHELSTAHVVEFERHLQHCQQCPVELVNMDLLSERIQLAQLYEPAPASLRKKIRASLRPVVTTTAMSQPLLWHWLAAAAALLLLVIGAWKVNSALRTDDYQAELAGEIVDAHVRSLQPGLMTAIASDNEGVVKGWLDGRAGFAVPVSNFANAGFALKGGRVDVIEGRTLAVLVYERNRRPINVFIWHTREADTSARIGSRQGFQWVDWRKGKLEFCVVSDADPVDLEQLHRLIAG